MNRSILTAIFAALSIFAMAMGASAMGNKSGQQDKGQMKEAPAPKQDNQQMVREALDGMIDAYSGRNAARFMTFVSEDFGGDKTILDRAIRKDFSLYMNTDIRYTFNNVTTDSSGKLISASVTFNRSHTVIKTGQQAKSSGTADFVFKLENNTLRLTSMKRSPLFGLSGL